MPTGFGQIFCDTNADSELLAVANLFIIQSLPDVVIVNCVYYYYYYYHMPTPAWHHLINRTQAQHLESVQKTGYPYNFQFYSWHVLS